jgi:hypothetical protein
MTFMALEYRKKCCQTLVYISSNRSKNYKTVCPQVKAKLAA